MGLAYPATPKISETPMWKEALILFMRWHKHWTCPGTFEDTFWNHPTCGESSASTVLSFWYICNLSNMYVYIYIYTYTYHHIQCVKSCAIYMWTYIIMYIYIYVARGLTLAWYPWHSIGECNLLCCLRIFVSHTENMQNIGIDSIWFWMILVLT